MAYPKQSLTSDDLALLERAALFEARESFWAYRQYINERLKLSWFQKLVAQHLQKFANDLVSGRKPKLILEAPPQHGKSVQVIDLISYIAGLQPDIKTIYASFSDRLGIRANLRLQRIYDSVRYKKIFPHTRINTAHVVTLSGQTLRNREIIEYIGREGSFRNTTVNGAITGEGLDLGVLDDPIKGREAANSEAIRNKTWDWFTDDFFTRFSEEAGLLAMLTRWNVDDVIGRYIDTKPAGLVVLKFPAIAETDEFYRRKGEPLFPNHKSLEFLLERKAAMTASSWEALYQQNPIIAGGSLFPIDRFQVVAHHPMKSTIAKSVRYWDKAGTSDGGAYSAGVLMHCFKDGRYCISDVVRGQWSALDREIRIKQTTEIDAASYGNYEVWVEQEPGSGGLESAQRSVAMLAGYKAFRDRVRGDKETRAEPYAAQVQAGNVQIVAATWNRPFLSEHETFPNGPYKDQVDSAAGAFMKCNPVGSKAGVLF